MAVIDEHSIIDHRRGLERFELLVRIQPARTEFPPGQTARADQYGAINRRRRLGKFPVHTASGVGSGVYGIP